MFSSYLTYRRLKAVIPYLQGDVLDLGCGYGHLIKYIKPGQVYIGVDGAEHTISWLVDHYPQLTFYKRDLDIQMLEINRKFDRIFLVALLEHLNHPEFVLSQIQDYLRPNGRLIITTPTTLGGKIHRLGAHLGLVYSEAARDHKYFYDHEALQRLLKSHNLIEEQYQRFLLGENQIIVARGINPSDD